MELEVTNKHTGLNRLELLRKLQSIDNKIQELNRKKETILKRIENKEAQIEDAKALLEKRLEEAKNFQKKIDSKYLDLQCIEDQIKKFRSQLLQIKNNKEYSALLSEIGGKEADKSLLEDEILNMMSELEGMNAAEKELKQGIERLERELAELKLEVEGELAAIDRDIKDTQAQWKEIAQQVDEKSFAQYRRLIEKDGLAVVEVSGEACGGCFMHITPQTLNQLLSRQELIFCQNCGKILYLQEG